MVSELNDHSSREHALLSASSAARWLACPPSALAAELYPQQDTEFTREGTLAHEVAEQMVRCGAVKKQDGITEEMLECARGYRDYIQEQIKGEGAGLLLEQRVDYSPWAPDGFGTCDCILIQGDTLTIIDYKYGKGVAVSAEDNPQMRLYALGAIEDYGIAYDVAKVEMHIYQPRLNNISTETMSVEELLDWGEGIKPTAALAREGKGDYTPGEHCRFCPHAGRCMALTSSCMEWVEAHGVKVGVPLLPPYKVAEVLAMEPQIALWLKRVKDQALTSLLNGEEIPGYKVVEGKLGNRKWTDDASVLDALLIAGYDVGNITETKVLSPASMDRAIGKKKVAELLEPLIERAPGAPTVVPSNDKRPPLNRLAEAQKDFE